MNEGKFSNFIRGFDPEKIADEVSGLNDQALRSMARMASPGSAKRVLSPKDYAYYSAAVAQLDKKIKQKEIK